MWGTCFGLVRMSCSPWSLYLWWQKIKKYRTYSLSFIGSQLPVHLVLLKMFSITAKSGVHLLTSSAVLLSISCKVYVNQVPLSSGFGGGGHQRTWPVSNTTLIPAVSYISEAAFSWCATRADDYMHNEGKNVGFEEFVLLICHSSYLWPRRHRSWWFMHPQQLDRWLNVEAAIYLWDVISNRRSCMVEFTFACNLRHICFSISQVPMKTSDLIFARQVIV